MLWVVYGNPIGMLISNLGNFLPWLSQVCKCTCSTLLYVHLLVHQTGPFRIVHKIEAQAMRWPDPQNGMTTLTTNIFLRRKPLTSARSWKNERAFRILQRFACYVFESFFANFFELTVYMTPGIFDDLILILVLGVFYFERTIIRSNKKKRSTWRLLFWPYYNTVI